VLIKKRKKKESLWVKLKAERPNYYCSSEAADERADSRSGYNGHLLNDGGLSLLLFNSC